jgi:hypothetical protein
MAPVRPVDSVGQVVCKQQIHNNVPGSLCDSFRPWNKNHHQSTTWNEGKSLTKPSKPTPNKPRTYQQDHVTQPHERNSSPRQNPTRPCTGQTGHAWAALDEQRPRVNSLKSNSRSPDLLHGFSQDFWDSRNTSWTLYSQVMVHQN